MARQIIIGDIHGCYYELCDLLDLISPSDDDRIIAVGDVVDRGPDSEKVIEFFKNKRNTDSLIGNHERKHIRSSKGEIRPALSQKITKQQLGDSYDEWLAFMESFPKCIELPDALIVHGMFEPGVPLTEQRDTVIIGTLTGEKYLEKNYPKPWYDLYKGTKPIVVGHLNYLRNGEPLIREGLVYAIDTGCATGGRLTALVLPEFKIVSVPSREDYWSRTKQEFAVLSASDKLNLDLDWITLENYASAKNGSLEQMFAERARQCDMIKQECERLGTLVCGKVYSLSSTILDELSTTPEWKKLVPKKRVSRYAQQVQKDPLAPLLYKARQKRLDDKAVYKFAKTPRKLLDVAEQFGIETRLAEIANKV